MGTRETLIAFMALVAVAGISVPAVGQQPASPGREARGDSQRMPDERPLWSLLRNRRFQAVLDAIENLRTAYPDWKPPAQLVRFANEGLAAQRAEEALIASDPERKALVNQLQTDPKNPQALLRLALLDIRLERIDAATGLLKRLKAAHPGHPAVVQLEEALRIAGKDRRRMARIQLLSETGKAEEAAAEMRQLFPKGPPAGGDLALEYFRIIGNTPAGWEEARKNLEKLVREFPNDTHYQVALARHLTYRDATRRAGIQSLAALARKPGLDKQLALDTWRRVLGALDDSSENVGLYHEYLAVDPENVSVRDMLEGELRAEARREPWRLRDRADDLLKEQRLAEAVADLKKALELSPDNPWVRFDLARLYGRQGFTKQGRALMEEGIRVAPTADMYYANAVYFGLLGDPDTALFALDKVPESDRTQAMLSLRGRLAIQSQIRKAKTLARQGRRADALAVMESTGKNAGNDYELLGDVADAWIDLGESSRGIGAMREMMSRQSAPSVAMRLRYAMLLNRTEQDEELALLLDRLNASGSLSEKEKEDYRQLRGWLAARTADNRRQAGDNAGARAVLDPVLKQDPDNRDLLMALARVYVAAGEPDKAQANYRRVLALSPKDVSARLAVARLKSEMGDSAAAQRDAEMVLSDAAADDLETRLAVADWFVDTKAPAAARGIVEPFRSLAAEDSRVQVILGRIARSEGNYGEAMDYFRKAGADPDIARIEKERKGAVVTAGVDHLFKSGTPGISQLSVVEVPVEVRVPAGYAGQAFFHIDPVNVRAGKLQPDDTYNIRQYGKVQASSSAANPSATIAGTEQNARGTALAAGYESNDLRADIGTTPLGFPVSDVVGGLKLYRSIDSTSYSLDIARRPVTSSLLSYAGVRDPVTGQVWGGVRSNGATLRTWYENGRLDAFADVGYYLLTGENVLTNREFALRTGFDWDFVHEADMRFSLGLALTNWRYQENLRFYSFGHGGYYSPQRYYSLTLPARWTGREGRWSYVLRASVSAAVSYEKDMPYYPTDSALQAQANQQAQTAGSSVYTGGNGHSTGYSASAALEYQMAPRLFAGGRFGIDRTAYYTPNFASLYVRYTFDAQSGPVSYPPEPVKPYSRF